MVEIQNWLNENYPWDKRKKVIKLDIGWLRKEAKNERLAGSLNLKGFTNLKELSCSYYDSGDPDDAYISLTKLSIGDCPNLEKLNCGGNQLSSLDISQNKNLKEISCSENKINILDISNLDKLERLDCRNNQLIELRLNRNIRLRTLLCSGNLLTHLNFGSLNPDILTTIFLDNNNFPVSDLACFSGFSKLEDLRIGTQNERAKQGIYNRFYGSLEVLKDLNNLKKLDIINTNINSGLEYLSETLEKIYYLKTHGWGISDPQSEQLIPNLDPHYQEREWVNGLGEWDSEMYYDMQEWRKANLNLIKQAKRKETILTPSSSSSTQKTAENLLEKNQPTALSQSQLKELNDIVLPNKNNFDFATLKQEIKNLKTESLNSQIENKNKEIEQLTNLIGQEKLHFKTRQELQKLVQAKQNEIRQLEQQLSNLQQQEQATQIIQSTTQPWKNNYA